MNTTTPAMGTVTPGLPAAQYHAHDSVSNSMLSAMAKSPAHCYGLHLDPQRPPNEPTAAMAAGTLAHTAILEPDELPLRYVAKPAGMSFAEKEGKAWRASQPPYLRIVSQADMTTALAQREAVLRVPVLAQLLARGQAEASCFWTDRATGLACRARPDWLHYTGPTRVTVVDVKTISELTPDAVAKAIAKYGYHRQQAHYSAGVRACGLEIDEFVFAFVSGSWPFVAAAYVLDDESRDQGVDEVAELMQRYAHCKRTNTWPAFGDGYQLTSLPAWAKRSNEVEVSFAN